MKKILITGSTGFVGSALIAKLTKLKSDYKIYKLVRSTPKDQSEIFCDYVNKKIDIEALEGFHAIIHLAGDNIASSLWTKKKKQKIYSSRVEYTKFLVESILNLKNKPKKFISASAIGIYGDRPNEVLNEDSTLGSGFLADVCKGWEKSSKILEENNIDLIHIRIGVVLDKMGGALAKMLPVFKLGLAGNLGSGQQMMSWISLNDLVNALIFLLNTNEKGVFNLTAPKPISNKEFTKILSKKLNRPAFFHVPSFILKLVLGELATETLLTSADVRPERLLKIQFKFEQPTIDLAI